ncbi:MAG TPA: metallophosphoesterase [Thermoplasmata archaeon]|nr:metallophosphoesterase [Thermoplasmata archaeon]
MRIAAVGDVHGPQNLATLVRDLERLGPVDLFLLAGDTTDRNDLEGFRAVLEAIRSRVDAPVWIVFGNNEWSQDHAAYVSRFGDGARVRFLQDEAAVLEAPSGRVRVVGSLGALDRPTWWQRKNLPHLATEYGRRIATLDGLLSGDGPTLLLTHYPPTYATMGDEQEAWRPELGCKALEPVIVRRRPALVVHGHIHKGIPYAELGAARGGLDAFLDGVRPVPVHNVAYPVRHGITVLDL